MRRIEHLLIVAGPTGCGKKTLIREILASRIPEVQTRIGVENLQECPWMGAHLIARLTELELKRLILHYDFLWSSDGSKVEMPGGQSASSILEGARQVSLVTVWTPPARLERQLIEGKLQTPLQANNVQVLKAGIFRRLPYFAIRGLSRFPFLKQINHWLPRRPFIHHLLLLRLYTRPNEVVAMYRRWFQFCDRQIPKTRDHVIVEFDRELKFYSRDEWENRIQIYQGG